jgi:coproporphyrinogen III oxidase
MDEIRRPDFRRALPLKAPKTWVANFRFTRLGGIMDNSVNEDRQVRARTWFEALRNAICGAFEALEDEAPAALYPGKAGRFVRTPWHRTDHTGKLGGGDVMSMMYGRLFEKVGVHCSTVHGELSSEFCGQIQGAAKDPRFWTSGISLTAHMRSPHVPAVHMNTRFIVTRPSWFGGGADLTPVLDRRRSQEDPDSIAFHAAMKAACDRHATVASYENYKNGATSIFPAAPKRRARHRRHLLRPSRFRRLGRRFRIHPSRWSRLPEDLSRLIRRNFATPWTEAEREEQLIRRGRYVKFNLLYDRGTLFGLQTGGNIDSILSSMPPEVKWP